MNIIEKISTIKAVSNLIVLRSKYDKVCDELACRELEANKSNDLIETIEPMLKESLDKVEYMLCKNNDLAIINKNLVIECKELRKEKNDNHDKYLEEKRVRWTWYLEGFALGVFTWAMIVKYLFV